jgi:hypothetical protein
MGESGKRLREKGMRHEMMARNAKKLATTSERLEELTSEELTEVSGGGMPFYGYRPVYGYRPFYGYRPVYGHRPFYGYRQQFRCNPYF